MASFRKKLVLILFVLFAAVTAGVCFLFTPESPSAQAVDDGFKITDGVFNGLTDEKISSLASAKAEFTIKLPASVTEIGDAKSSENELFGDAAKYLTGVTFDAPENITKIGNGAFVNCTALSDFTIPSGVTAIGDRAFYNCTSLTTVTVPENVRSIGFNAFYGLSGVTEINYYATNATNVTARPFAMANYGSQSVTVHIGGGSGAIAFLPTGLFEGHKGVKEVYFDNVNTPNGVQGFGTSVFKDCTSLERVVFSESCNISVLNSGTFSGCINLYSVTGLENNNFKTIASNAFNGCRSLYSVTVGSGITAINEKAFFGCIKLLEVKNLSNLTITAGDAEVNGDVARYAKYVYGIDGETRIDLFDGWVFYADITDTANGIFLLDYKGTDAEISLPAVYAKDNEGYPYNIYGSAFIENKTLTGVTVPDKIKKIGDSAFAGCTSLVAVTLSGGLLELGDNAFQSCASLMTVNFNNNTQLSVIPNYAFSKCTSLERIEIPAGVRTINSYAFSDCDKLVTVKFNADGVTKISSHAFDGCSSLSAIKLPATVTTVEVSVFENCAGLQFIYLPADADYKEDAFKNCNKDLILISADAESYASDKLKENLSGFVADGRLTYAVKINLVYPDTCVDVIGGIDGMHANALQKLYNLSGALVQDSETFVWTEGGMPVQGHSGVQAYETSKWFTDDTYSSKVDIAELTEMLKDEGISEITLYARYYAHPALTAKEPVDYDSTKEYDISEILTALLELDGNAITAQKAQELTGIFNIEVINHKLPNGGDDGFWHSGKAVSDAGTYTLSVSLPKDGSFGVWKESLTLEFTISAIRIDITDLLVWNGLSHDSTASTLYFYNNNGTPYLEEIEGSDQKTVERINSHAVYTGHEITISLDWIDTKYGTIGSYTGVKETDAGTYKATAVITPSSNYILEYRTDTATLNKLAQYGLKLDKDTANGTISVEKEWFIALSNVNQLLANDEDGGGLYNIPSEWTYGDGTLIPKKPVASKNPAETVITFNFKFTDPDGEVVAFDDVSLNYYTSYFNVSMPAGEYEVTFFIDKDAGGDPAGTKFNFTVKPAVVTRTHVTQFTGMIFGGDVGYESSAPRFRGAEAVASLNIAYPQRTPGSNYLWFNYKQYYTPFEIRYCFALGNEVPSGKYMTEEEFASAGNDVVKPSAIGSYTVYYKIQAPNYGTEISGSYILNITHTLNPVTHDYDFDGKNILNGVVSELKRQIGSEYYDICTALDYDTLSADDLLKTETMRAPETLIARYGDKFDTYTKVGKHYIFLKIKDGYSSYIRWNGIDSTEYFVIAIEIKASLNSLSINEWQYGRFDSSNIPVFDVSFGPQTQYIFKLLVDGQEQYLYYSNKDINDHVPADHTLKAAPVGKYTLVATAFVAGDTSQRCEIETTVEVHKVSIDFAETPYIKGWTYGQITADTDLSGAIKSAVTLKADIDQSVKGEFVLKFIEASKYPGNISSATAKLPADSHGFVPSGDYYVILTREGDGTYEELEEAVRFSVLPAVNHWKNTPEDIEVSDISIKKDAENSLFNLFTTYYGTADDMKIEIREKNGAEWRNVADSSFPYAGVTGNLNVGEYEMRITVGGSDVIGLMETVSLTVVNATVPSEGNNPDGNGNGDGNGGISDTIVLAVIIAFAAIAVIVAIVGASIVSAKNKKANAEFIKTVKSEMKRR